MKLSSFRYIGPQAVKSMSNNGWMTVAAILTVTITLFLCAVFWLLLMNIDANVTKVEDDIRIVAYLDSTVNLDEQKEEIEKEIKWIGGVADVTFISKEEGIESLEDRFNNIDIISTLGGNNPLPDCYSITAISADYVPTIAKACEEIEGIDIVRYGAGTVEKLFSFTDVLRKVGMVVMGLLALAAVLLVAMVIRLAIVSRRKEIMIMKWVGATDAFIRWPFFLEGLVLGVFGAILAAGLALLLYGQGVDTLIASLPFAEILPLSDIWLNTSLFTIGAGLGLGALGSFLPLTRFLDV